MVTMCYCDDRMWYDQLVRLPQDKVIGLLAMCATCVWWHSVHDKEEESSIWVALLV